MTRSFRLLALVSLLSLILAGCISQGPGAVYIAGHILDQPPERFIRWESVPEEQRPPELEQFFDETDEAAKTSRTAGVRLDDDRVDVILQFCKDEWERQTGGPA